MDADEPRQSLADWDFWRQGLDRGFFSRVYRRSTQLGAVAALLLLGADQQPVALGLVSGLSTALFSTWTCEATVRLLFRGGSFAGVKLAAAALVKMPALLAILVAIAWACHERHMNVFGVLGGVLLMHGTLFTMAIAMALAAQEPDPAQRR